MRVRKNLSLREGYSRSIPLKHSHLSETGDWTRWITGLIQSAIPLFLINTGLSVKTSSARPKLLGFGFRSC